MGMFKLHPIEIQFLERILSSDIDGTNLLVGMKGFLSPYAFRVGWEIVCPILDEPQDELQEAILMDIAFIKSRMV